jgi:hypothetical protein
MLTIEGINKLESLTTARVSVLNVVEQRDLYSIEYLYNNPLGENSIYYLVIMRDSKDRSRSSYEYSCYLVDNAKGMAYPIGLYLKEIQSPNSMMSELGNWGHAMTNKKLNGSPIQKFSDLKNLVF